MQRTDGKLEIASNSHIGLRASNQDTAIAVQIDPAESLWGFKALVGVADGMGGHSAGDVASRIASDTIGEILGLRKNDTGPLVDEVAGMDATEATAQAARTANLRIFRQAMLDESQYDMGTTLTFVGVTGETAVVAHVGDSRGYLINSAGIHQVTQDHSWVAEQVRRDRMTEDEARTSPMRNQITRTLGAAASVDLDMLAIPLEENCIYLTCTDGITHVLKADRIAEIVLSNESLQEACDSLISEALASGATDNLTVSCVEIGHIERGTATGVASDAADEKTLGATDELYPVIGRTAHSGGLFEARRMRPLLAAVGVIALIVAVLLMRSCLMAPAQQVAHEVGTDSEQPAMPASAIQLPPIEQGLVVRIAVNDDKLIAAANRHVQVTIHPPGSSKNEPKVVIGPEGDYTRPLNEQEVTKWADAVCQIKLWAEGDYVHLETQPADLDVYINQKMVKDRKVRASSIAGDAARVGFYFPSNNADGYTVALTAVDAENLPVPFEKETPEDGEGPR